MRFSTLRPAVILSAALLFGGCASDAPVTHARVTHEGLNSVLWMQTSGEYWAACTNAYASAQTQLDLALADPKWTAALEQTGDASKLPPAVILDADETALDNSIFQAGITATNDFFTPVKFKAWCAEERAGAVPGAAEFCRYAFEKGVTVVILTNRDASVEDATRRNMEKLGFPAHPERVLVIGKSGESDKGPRRKTLCERYRVVLLVGDQLGDFLSVPKGTDAPTRLQLAHDHAARWGRQWIALPNPAYGDWERALMDSKATDEENLKKKFEALKR